MIQISSENLISGISKLYAATGSDTSTNRTIIIDNGSGFMQAGFAGENIQRVVFSTIVGQPKMQMQTVLHHQIKK